MSADLDPGMRFIQEHSAKTLIIGGVLALAEALAREGVSEDIKVGSTSPGQEGEDHVVVQVNGTNYALTIEEARVYASSLEVVINMAPEDRNAPVAGNLALALRHCADKLEKRTQQ